MHSTKIVSNEIILHNFSAQFEFKKAFKERYFFVLVSFRTASCIARSPGLKLFMALLSLFYT